MIQSLTGRLIEVRAQSIVLNPGVSGESGFEFEIFVPAYWVAAAGSLVGRTVRVYTRVHLESVNQGASFTPRLIGFPTPEDRAFFEAFTSVKGLGTRKALKALAYEPGVIAGAIAARDARTLQKLPEIGKRLAETIIAELHGKLEGSLTADLPPGELPPLPPGDRPSEEAVAALVALGQTRAEAEQAVGRALRSLGTPESPPTTAEIVERAFAAG